MKTDMLEMMLYVVAIGIIPYLAVETYEMLQRTIMKRKRLLRH